MSELIINTQSVSKHYQISNQIISALENCTLSIAKGEQIAIMGRSGAGKSTLLHLLAGMDEPTSGSMDVCGTRIQELSPSKRAEFRLEHIGYVFQSYNLIPELTLQDNIRLPSLLLHNKVDTVFFTEIVQSLGLTERLTHFPNELSGGQQQRAAIARAIINKPELLLCDEPTGNLDSQTSNEVIDLLRNLASQYQLTLLIVTHDEEIAQKMQRIIRINDGEVQE